MEVIKEFLFIAALLLAALVLANILVSLYWGWHKRKNDLISEQYRKALEDHKEYDGV